MTTITIKRSSTASAIPLAGDLAVGELAVNLEDKRLFTKQSDGTIIELSTNPTDLDAAALRIDGVEITASATELNSLDGFTGSTAELNLLDGLTATTIELNTLDGITASTAELNKLDGYTGSTAELNILDGVTATTAELNFVDGVTSNVQTQLNAKQPLDAQLTDIAGLTPTDGTFIVGNGINFVAESGDTAIASLGVTATATELNTLDGITASTTELNYTDGVTSNIQTQLNGKATSAQGALADSAVQPNDNVTFGTGDFTGSVDVTGTVTADGLTVDGDVDVTDTTASNTSTMLTLRDNRTTIDEQNYVLSITRQNSATSSLYIGNNDDNEAVIAGNNTSTYIGRDVAGTFNNTVKFGGNGDVSFYEDTGTTAKMVWDSSAESLGIGGAPLHKLSVADGAHITVANAVAADTSGSYTLAVGKNSGNKSAIFAGDVISSGKVGIGTSSPSSAIHVKGGSTTTSTSATDFIANSTARLVTNHANEYGAYIGYINSSNDAVAIHSMRSNGVGAPLSLNTFGGNVGIGTASPSVPLQVQGDGNSFRLDGTANTGRGILIRNAGTSTAYLKTDGNLDINCEDAGRHIAFKTADTERARLDSSGNFMVGTTNSNVFTSSSENGFYLTSTGQARQSVNSVVQYLNRTGSDGTITNFAKNGSTVGSIGTKSGAIIVEGTNCGFWIDPTNVVVPTDGASSGSNGVMSLGSQSNRFKDLYLSRHLTLGNSNSSTIRPRMTLQRANAGGAGIFSTEVSGKAQQGILYAIDESNGNYLIASLSKFNEANSIVSNTIDSSGLSLVATNAGGTIQLSSTASTVKMQVIKHILE